MIFVVLAAIGFVLALLHLAMQKQLRTRQRIADLLLLYAFALPIGLGGLVGFIGHTLRAAAVAASIGWPAGNPFQYEVAVANLAFGVLGVLCLRFRGGFWIATAIGWSVFMLGAAGVHLRQIHMGQPYAPDNAGATLYFNIIAPVCVLALLAIRNDKTRG
jgi:Family of unknown function (DUF6790)